MELFEILADTPWLLTGSVFVLSLLVGSFLNVVIHRLPIMLDRQWRAQAEEMLRPESAAPPPDVDSLQPSPDDLLPAEDSPQPASDDLPPTADSPEPLPTCRPQPTALRLPPPTTSSPPAPPARTATPRSRRTRTSRS